MQPIKTQNFSLRLFTIADIEAFARYRSIPEIARYQSWSEDFSYDDGLALFENMHGIQFGQVGYWFQIAIAHNETDQLMGDLAIKFINDEQVEIGFTIDPQFQKKGVAFEAVQILMQLIFNEFKKHRIQAVIDADNMAAYHLLQKLGFRQEAYFVENVYCKGRWGSEYAFAMLRSEWERI